MYKLVRSLLFRLDAETSHQIAFGALAAVCRIPGVAWWLRRRAARVPSLPVEVMGVQFPNPIGLAAGLDKNGRYVHALAGLGFGWLELGTVTPRPQPGNPKRRLFRLPTQRALINRMGFNNDGVHAFVHNVSRAPKPCLIAANIGKNRDTPLVAAVEDYLAALRAVYMHVAYVAINVSSPNTPGLRALQDEGQLDLLLRALKTEQTALAKMRGLYVPIALKIAPDLSHHDVAGIARLVLKHRIDAVIATNTTLTRPDLHGALLATEQGGLSGPPLKALATDIIRQLRTHLGDNVPIIGVGGIENAEDAWDKLVAGADLLQVYTALIYAGPGLVAEIVAGLSRKVAESNSRSLHEAVAKARKQFNVETNAT